MRSKTLLTATALLFLSACGYVAPDAGEEAVLVQQPWFFGDGGVVDTPVHTGSTVVASSTDAVMINVTPIAFEVTFDNLMPSNSIPLDFHTVVRMQVADSVDLVKNWNGAHVNKDGDPDNYWFWANIQPMYVNLVRNEVKKYDMNQLALTGQAIDAVEQAVTTKLDAYIKKTKMPVRLLSITMGRAGIPDVILNQKTATVAQQQRKLTMDAATEAEKARKASEQARAEADNAYRLAIGQSPEQYLEAKRIGMMAEACKTNTCIFGAGANMLINR